MSRLRYFDRIVHRACITSGLATMTWRSREREVNVSKAKKAVPEGHHTVTPQLTLENAAQSLAWYAKALGATEVSRSLGPDGKIMHAEIRVGDSPIMVNDAMMGSKGPKRLGGSPASLWVYVEDCDAL